MGGSPHLIPSDSAYEWLGKGIYCWEDSYSRALEWAEDRVRKSGGSKDVPAVLGIVFTPGLCMDLTDANDLDILEAHAKKFNALVRKAGVSLPKTNGLNHSYDCFMINAYHKEREVEQKPPIDTLRAAFQEGECLGGGRSAIHLRNHIQWVIRNTDCIIGYFRPNALDDGKKSVLAATRLALCPV